MDIGEAVTAMRCGYKIARKGWNSEDQWIALNPSSVITVSEGRPLAKNITIGTKVKFQEYVIMKTVQNTIVPWLCSQTDLLANDWIVVGEGAEEIDN